jgi:ACS family tartrate transporter-like MFS transporter
MGATVVDVGQFDDKQQGALFRKLLRRLIPFLFLSYVVSYLDRLNVGIASLTMSHDIGLTPRALGLGFGIFAVGYVICEIPSNLMLHRFGARLWIARIMITWGIVSAGTALVSGAPGFFVARFLLGVAEAGFVPGICYYLTLWFPSVWRAKAMVAFLVAVPITGVVGSPISGALLGMDGIWGLRGWQWLFILEGLPAIVLGFICLTVLTDNPGKANWLSQSERHWLQNVLDQEKIELQRRHNYTLAQVFTNRRVLILTAINFCYIVGTYGVGVWSPQLIKGFGFTNLQVGFVAAIPYLCGAIGMVLWARHSDKTMERSWHVAGAGFLAAVALAASGSFSSPLLAMIALTVGVTGNFAFFGTYWAIPPSFLSGRAAAGGIALIISVGNMGGLVGPYVLGWTLEVTHNFALGFAIMASFFLLAAILVLVLHYTTDGIAEIRGPLGSTDAVNAHRPEIQRS